MCVGTPECSPNHHRLPRTCRWNNTGDRLLPLPVVAVVRCLRLAVPAGLPCGQHRLTWCFVPSLGFEIGFLGVVGWTPGNSQGLPIGLAVREAVTLAVARPELDGRSGCQCSPMGTWLARALAMGPVLVLGQSSVHVSPGLHAKTRTA